MELMGVWNSLVLVYLIADQGGVAVAGKLIKARPCKSRQAIGRAVKINHRPQFSCSSLHSCTGTVHSEHEPGGLVVVVFS